MQDHVRPELLFAATEFGVFFTVNGGKNWVELTGGVPTIPFRDLAIQRRENDLVAASFGRGFYILDDYTPLRQATPAMLAKDAVLADGTRVSLEFSIAMLRDTGGQLLGIAAVLCAAGALPKSGSRPGRA